MPFVNTREPWIIFGIAVFALLLIAVGADNVTTRLQSSDYWVGHTLEVQNAVSDLRSDIYSAEGSRLLYLMASDKRRLAVYDAAVRSIPIELARLDELTAGSPSR